MDVTSLEWTITMVVAIVILVFDVFWIAHRPHEPTIRETALALTFYIALALAFGLYVWLHHGGTYGMEFLAGWITEYSLSIDNLFIFILIMTSFKVPRVYQQEALMVGIVLALILRGIFIAVGAAAIAHFAWVFYIFGGFLLVTALRLIASKDDDSGRDNFVVRVARRRLPMSDEWAGLRLWVRRNNATLLTPMFLVILALGSTDLLFAIDSIPAIFGLTQQAYLVFAANAFALMGLRQLYFLLGGLLRRLVYLTVGLSVILAFIGVKLVLHALAANDVPFINGGRGVPVPEIPTVWSLGVIVGVLLVTAGASLVRTRNAG